VPDAVGVFSDHGRGAGRMEHVSHGGQLPLLKNISFIIWLDK
jgi:hypothetical protein